MVPLAFQRRLKAGRHDGLRYPASYRECVLKEVNLGEDTDNIAAIAGGWQGWLTALNAYHKSGEIPCSKVIT